MFIYDLNSVIWTIASIIYLVGVFYLYISIVHINVVHAHISMHSSNPSFQPFPLPISIKNYFIFRLMIFNIYMRKKGLVVVFPCLTYST